MINKITKMAMATGAFALVLFSCSQPNKELQNKNYNHEYDSALAIKTDTGFKTLHQDSIKEYSLYSKSINLRFDKNVENLTRMKKDFLSDDSIIKMKYDQEIFDLNKRNVQIKSKANNRANHNLKTWDVFKSSTNVEMNELENSIKVLSERIS